jgi:hypothetical protein
MILVIYLVLYFPVYFFSRWAFPLTQDWTEAGIHAVIALVFTFVLVIALYLLKDWLFD